MSVSRTEVLGDPLSDLIGASVGELRDSETIELMTDEGRRQFDPALSRLTDQHGRTLGHTLSLHDVTELELASRVRGIAGGTRGRDGTDLSLSVPETATLVTERHAVEAATESAIENAFSRATNRVRVSLEAVPEGYLLTVVDDGPGIPDDEIASVSAGTETPLQHATGLGLWQLKWAVTKFNGDLTIDNDGGTTVEIRIPDQRR